MEQEENIPKQHGFNTPDGYLDGLEERLSNLSALESLPKEPGFQVPEGYFESLEDRILKQIEPTTKVRTLWYQRSYVRASMAAAAILLLALFVIEPGGTDSLELPETAEVAAYLDSEAVDLNADELLGYLEEDELDGLFEDETLVELDELESYILENLDDSELLIEIQQ